MNKESQTTFHEAQPTQEQETKTKTAGTACASPLKTKHTTKCNCQMTCINNTLFKWELLWIWFQCRKQQLKTIIVNKLLAILVLHTTSWRWKKIIAALKQFTPAHSHMILLSAINYTTKQSRNQPQTAFVHDYNRQCTNARSEFDMGIKWASSCATRDEIFCTKVFLGVAYFQASW